MELIIDKETAQQIAKSVVDAAESFNGSFTKEEVIEKIQVMYPLVDAEQCAEVCSRVWMLLTSSNLLLCVKDNYYRILTQRELNAIKKAYVEASSENNEDNIH